MLHAAVTILSRFLTYHCILYNTTSWCQADKQDYSPKATNDYIGVPLQTSNHKDQQQQAVKFI